MMHFCAITKSNECSLFACFESLQCPKIVLTVIKKGVFFKSFPDPAGGLTAPPLTPSWFSLGPTHSFLPCDGPAVHIDNLTLFESCFGSCLHAQTHGQLGSALSRLTKKHIPWRPFCSLKLLVQRCQTAKTTRSLKLLRQKDERGGTMRLSINSLQHLRDVFSPCATSRCLPSFTYTSRRQTARPAPTIVQDPGLPIWRRSRRSRSQERLRTGASKKWRLMHGWRRVGPQTERGSQLSRAKKCEGWAPH